MERMQRAGLVEIAESIVTPREHGRHLLANLLVIRMVHNANRSASALGVKLIETARISQETKLVPAACPVQDVLPTSIACGRHAHGLTAC